MSASKEWLDATTNNIANMNTTRTEEGGPYHRQSVVFKSQSLFDDLFQKHIGGGVKVDKIVEDQSEKLVYDPKNPDADKDGNVRYPDINLAAEMTNMIMAQRSYEADVTTLNSTKQVIEKTYEIGKI
jgi:flagellar basal-body rod protein FlgC